MLRTLKNLFKQDREKFVVPKSVQNVIPIKTIWDDGIFLVGRNKYAKTFKFEDINYAVASREDKEAMFLEYSELLNSLDSGATTKITINNRRLNKADFEQTILIPMADDGLDKYRKEYNKMLLDKATGDNSIVQDKYVTVSVCKKNIEEARNYFARVGADIIAHFNRLGSKCVELDAGGILCRKAKCTCNRSTVFEGFTHHGYICICVRACRCKDVREMPGVFGGESKCSQCICYDIRCGSKVLTRCRSKVHDAFDTIQHVVGFPSGHRHVVHSIRSL